MDEKIVSRFVEEIHEKVQAYQSDVQSSIFDDIVFQIRQIIRKEKAETFVEKSFVMVCIEQLQMEGDTFASVSKNLHTLDKKALKGLGYTKFEDVANSKNICFYGNVKVSQLLPLVKKLKQAGFICYMVSTTDGENKLFLGFHI